MQLKDDFGGLAPFQLYDGKWGRTNPQSHPSSPCVSGTEQRSQNFQHYRMGTAGYVWYDNRNPLVHLSGVGGAHG